MHTDRTRYEIRTRIVSVPNMIKTYLISGGSQVGVEVISKFISERIQVSVKDNNFLLVRNMRRLIVDIAYLKRTLLATKYYE